MTSNWTRKFLSEVCTKIGSGQTPRGGKESYKGGDFSLVRSQNIYNQGFTNTGLVYIDDKQADQLSNVEVLSGDVLINITGDSVARSCMIPERILPARVNQHVAILRADKKNLHNGYLRYFLISPKVQSLLSSLSSGGATRKALTKSMLESLEIVLPTFSDQKAIAHILGKLDEKIELNQKTNETLEGIATALFKSWFIDFDPVKAKAEGHSTGLPDEMSELFPDSFENSELGEIPCEWSICSIGDLLDLERKSIQPGDVPEEVFAHYSIPAFDETMLPSKELGQSIKSNKYLVSEGVFLVSKLNPRFPRIWLPSFSDKERGICSTEFLVCRTKKSIGISFGYCLSKSPEVIQQMIELASGTSNSHQRVRPIDFTSITTICPSQPLLNLFTEEVAPFLQKIPHLLEQNLILSNCRDVLLPKLISGELRVPDAEKMLEEVGI